ncbi:MAG TPA: AAA family ATPase [Candidatus Paceibacterota bacterium]|nr:AAA family ATPase [Candidatus Paceibacterota bacterium]HQO70764.1 AAA family ATPase [Candidatus Paceibacterota bacterium]HQQ21798.1 AAA family ATPase [Candidatus Paceibacterota bacterium]
MRLKSILLVGFKSFGKKSLITFNTPITAIVGPNGSGKSNIVEAIRFVLGEQSMKSLRGKGGVDLIFKGSRLSPSSSRALVSITFDNSDKIFTFSNSGTGVSLDYNEIIISREVFADGSNKYSINQTEVRLKDIVDLLSSVNIGSSGHHIISQGEADRILNASNKERRSMIEDALGLRVYQYRIKESEKRLEKTLINMKEVQSLRREIAPHLSFLKKQVSIIEKSEQMRQELKELYRTYLSKEATYVKHESGRLSKEHLLLKEKENNLNQRISELEKDKAENQKENIFTTEIKEHQLKLSGLIESKNELLRNLGRIEGMIEGLEERFRKQSESKKTVIQESDWQDFISLIDGQIDQALKMDNLEGIINCLKNLKNKITEFYNQSDDNPVFSLEDDDSYKEMISKKEELIFEKKRIETEIEAEEATINSKKEEERQSLEAYRDSEKNLYELLRQRTEVSGALSALGYEEEKLASVKAAFDMELTEAGVLIGREIVSFAETEDHEEVNRPEQEALRKKIERIKIKIEDAGGGSGEDVVREYKETVERDEFLGRELEDLNKSIKDCNILIAELKEKLDNEFKQGVENINTQFQNFFALMFGGGGAFLSVTMEHKKPKKDDLLIEQDALEEDEESEIGFERGIEINVNLPHKKVRDLHMLSGGERSLTSIALLFAISQVNPPPFLVLDETDAALDEANSKKYGNMLENLSDYSQLIVVTHNRETMTRAEVLYGVTMSAEGVSKLLSIKFEEATGYAK